MHAESVVHAPVLVLVVSERNPRNVKVITCVYTTLYAIGTEFIQHCFVKSMESSVRPNIYQDHALDVGHVIFFVLYDRE